MLDPNEDEKIDCLHTRRRRCSKLVSVNYCIPGTMSSCSAGATWQEQSKCKFAKKSTINNRCMHYIASINGHCDCVEAQRELSSDLNQLNED